MFITTACTSKSRSKKNSSNSSSNTLSTVPCLFAQALLLRGLGGEAASAEGLRPSVVHLELAADPSRAAIAANWAPAALFQLSAPAAAHTPARAGSCTRGNTCARTDDAGCVRAVAPRSGVVPMSHYCGSACTTTIGASCTGRSGRC